MIIFYPQTGTINVGRKLFRLRVTHRIWNELTKQLNHKILPTSLYISVFKDRNNRQTNLRKFLNINLPNADKLNCISDTGNINDENCESNEKIEDGYCTISKSENKTIFI